MAGDGTRKHGEDEVDFRQVVDDHIVKKNHFNYCNTLEGDLNVKQLQKSQDFICAESKKMKNINESIAEKMYKNKAKDEEDKWKRAKDMKEYAKEKAQGGSNEHMQKKAKARKLNKEEGASDEPEAEGEAEENEKDDDEEEAEAHAEVTRKPAAAVQKRPAACETNLAPEMGDFQYDFNREMQATDFAMDWQWICNSQLGSRWICNGLHMGL